jgi:sec-independent protein translocase protein TatA
MGLENPLHIAALVVIVLLVFGAKRLPELGRSLGSGMREFKEGVTGASDQPTLTSTAEQQPPAPVQQPAEQIPVAAPSAQTPSEPQPHL